MVPFPSKTTFILGPSAELKVLRLKKKYHHILALKTSVISAMKRWNESQDFFPRQQVTSSLWGQGRTISAARYAGDMAQPNLNRLHESHTIPRPNWFFHPSVAPVARHSGNWAKSRSSGLRRRRSLFFQRRGEKRIAKEITHAYRICLKVLCLSYCVQDGIDEHKVQSANIVEIWGAYLKRVGLRRIWAMVRNDHKIVIGQLTYELDNRVTG